MGDLYRLAAGEIKPQIAAEDVANISTVETDEAAIWIGDNVDRLKQTTLENGVKACLDALIDNGATPTAGTHRTAFIDPTVGSLSSLVTEGDDAVLTEAQVAVVYGATFAGELSRTTLLQTTVQKIIDYARESQY